MSYCLSSQQPVVLRGPLEPALHPTSFTVEFFARIGIDTGAGQPLRRPLVRSCLDWTERRRHLAGRLGAAALEHLLDVEAITRQRGTRALTITEAGKRYLFDVFGVSLSG